MLSQDLNFKEKVTRHWIMQLCMGMFVAIGFVVIYVNKNLNNKLHFQSYHGIVGLITVVVMALVAGGGVLAKYSYDLRNYTRPVYSKMIHSFFGAVMIILSFVTVFLGFYSHWYEKFGNEYLKYVFSVILLLSLVNIIYRPGKLFVERFVTACMRSSL